MMRNRKYIRLLLAALLILNLLTGCGKREVVLDMEAGSEEASEDKSVRKGNVAEQIGFSEEDASWKETVVADGIEISIKAKISVPDVDAMYTMTASKKYLTAEDKQRILSCFVEPDSVRGNTEFPGTKEEIDETIARYEAVNEAGDIDEYLDYLKMRREYAPSMEELSEDVEDYNIDEYIGTADDTEYKISFYTVEDYERSAFLVKRVFDKNNIDICDWTLVPDASVGLGNECKMTREEAVKKALSLCESLGFPDMAEARVDDLMWMSWNEESAHGFEERWKDGYTVVLTRNIGGLPADATLYTYDIRENQDEYHSNYQSISYSREVVCVRMDDKGLVEFRALGLMDAGQLNAPVRLLGLDEIKNVIKETLEYKYADMYWYRLELGYARIAAEDGVHDFCYIPVWKYTRDIPMITTGITALSTIGSGRWINAIDGSLIDISDPATGTMNVESQGLGWYE